MKTQIHHPARGARGMVLITTLLLLVVVTLLALAMFRGVGLETKVAGNAMDKGRALQAASSAQAYTEQWLTNNVATNFETVCTPAILSAAGTPVICSNTLASATDAGSAAVLPWNVSGVAMGYTFDPTIPVWSSSSSSVVTETLPVSDTGGANTYYNAPSTYIAELGPDATVANATDYQVDAWTYAGAENTVAEVESTYQIRYSVQGSGP
jgi:type IV pilus assembly protein PilX